MIKVEQVVKKYGGVTALDGLSLSVPEQSTYGLVGPNGAGKTTLIRMIMGLLYPDSGSIMINDLEAGSQVRRLIRRIGYVPDNPASYPRMKLSEYMDFFAACYDLTDIKTRRRIQMLLEMVGLQNRQDQYVETLSPSMMQKLSLARALIHDPKILILDEPMRNMDAPSKYEYRQILGELSDSEKTILISSHVLMDIAEICTDIGIVDHGKKIMEGKLQDVLDEVNSSNPITISVEGNLAQAMRTLKADKKVRSISIHNRDILISYGGTEEDETVLLKEMVTAGIPVRSFHREKGNLEALFMQLTGERKERRLTSYEAESDL